MHDSLFDRAKTRDIVEVARSAGLKLHKAGAGRYKLCCPVHNEKSPSCFISSSGKYANRVHCFGCGWSGSVIDFYAGVYKVDVKEAARALAGSDRLSVVSPPRKQPAVNVEVGKFSDLYIRFIGWCKSYDRTYQKLAVFTYLQSRGLSADEIKQSALGAVPDYLAAAKWLQSQDGARDAGLLTDRGTFALTGYPLLIPSYDIDGRVMSLQGRKIDSRQGGPKYRFLKGQPKYPFGGHTLRKAGAVYLTEGVFDALGLSIIENAPALSMGGLNVSQALIGLLEGRKCRLVTDNDKAGDRERDKIIGQLRAGGINVDKYLLPTHLKDAGEALLARDSGKLEAMKAKNPVLGKLIKTFQAQII